MKEEDFWRSPASSRHINPRFLPEKDESRVSQYSDLDIVDFGCGVGRYTGYFSPDRYIGYDINSERVDICLERYPHYKFTNSLVDLPQNKVLFLYTVALHISDDQLKQTNAVLTPTKVILCESLDNPMNKGFNGANGMICYRRTVEDYERIFNKTGRITFTADLVGGDYQINFLELD